MKTVLLIQLLLLSIMSHASKSDICFKTPEEAAKHSLSSIKEFKEMDLLNDGESEFKYTGECSMRSCSTRVLFKINGCFKNVYSGSDNFIFINDIPQNIKDTFNNHVTNDSGFPLIRDSQHQCSGKIRTRSTFMYNSKIEQYIKIYSESFDLCKFK